LSSFSFSIASPSALVQTRSPVTLLQLPFVFLGGTGIYCTKYFDMQSKEPEPGVDAPEVGILDAKDELGE